jgi:phosphate transport system permease protein
MFKDIKNWFKSGDPFVWLNAGAVGASIVMVVGLLLLITARGMVHFWPHAVEEIQYQWQGEQVRIIGEVHDSEMVDSQRIRESGIDFQSDAEEIERYLMKIGNRDFYGVDFRTIIEPLVISRSEPADVMTVERTENGNFYGYLRDVKESGQVVASGDAAWADLQERIDRANELRDEIRHIEHSEIGAINYAIEKLRLAERRLELENDATPENLAELERERAVLNADYEVLQQRLNELYDQISRDSFTAEIQDGRIVEIRLQYVIQAFQPNSFGLFQKIGFYLKMIWDFVSGEPREANTEGGIFPAIFGTVMMVLVMAVLVTPLGVVAAVYLREYAKQGPLVRTIRIAVNNLAGVPSIVYGVFGLGFFVYFLGGNIDQLFYPEAAPAPVFGTPGMIWASLTLALLTLPVVIVSTEEGLARIPRQIREGSLALGATKAETLWRTVLPMASPAMMTGLILAVARAAGEVAPLMLVGVVKLAPSLAVDANFPFLHLDRKFMHLGFHIYDVGFQSPNVEAARPLVYATALLLVLVIIALNLFAIQIRNRLREKYRAMET